MENGEKIRIPGLKPVKSSYTETHEVEVYETTEPAAGPKLLVEFIRSFKKPDGAFLVARVLKPGPESELEGAVQLWKFQDEDFRGLGRLWFVKDDDEHVITLVDTQNRLHRVIPVADLPHITKVMCGGKPMVLGGRSASDLLKLKVKVAQRLNLDLVLLDEERVLLTKMREVEETEGEERRKALEEERRRKLNEILRRDTITAYTEEGQRRRGLPVTEDEWRLLQADTYCVLVDGEPPEPREAFVVGRDRFGKPRKLGAKKVTAKNPKDAALPQAIGLVTLKMEDGEIYQLLHFDSEGLAKLRATGANTGVMVAVGEPDKHGKLTVIQLVEGTGTEVKTIGAYKPI